MRRKILRLLLCATLATPLFIMSSAPPRAVTYLALNGNQFQYGAQSVRLRGTDFKNLNAWDAMIGDGDLGSISVKAADYQMAGVTKGANVVRFSIAWSWWAKQFNADGTCTVTPGCNFFTILDQHVAWATANKMWIVLALTTMPERTSDMDCSHPTPVGNCSAPESSYGSPPYVWTPYGCYSGHSSNVCPFWYENCPGCEVDQVNNFWARVSAHYATQANVAGYEILNLPQAPLTPCSLCPTPTAWSDFAARVYNTITSNDPNHFVIVEAGRDFNTPIVLGATKEVLAQHAHPACSADGDVRNIPMSQYDGTRPLWIDEFSENMSACGSGATWTSNTIPQFETLGYHWTHSNWRQPDIGTWQNYVAGDFTRPWTQLQNIVFPYWTGQVHPK